MNVRVGIGDVVVIDPAGKLWRNPGAAIAFVQITQTRNVLPILPERPHRNQVGRRASGVGRCLSAVTSTHHHGRRACVHRSCVAIACIDWEPICSPANKRHRRALIELGHKLFRHPMDVVFPSWLDMRLIRINTKVPVKAAQRFHPPHATTTCLVALSSIGASTGSPRLHLQTVNGITGKLRHR